MDAYAFWRIVESSSRGGKSIQVLGCPNWCGAEALAAAALDDSVNGSPPERTGLALRGGFRLLIFPTGA